MSKTRTYYWWSVFMRALRETLPVPTRTAIVTALLLLAIGFGLHTWIRPTLPTKVQEAIGSAETGALSWVIWTAGPLVVVFLVALIFRFFRVPALWHGELVGKIEQLNERTRTPLPDPDKEVRELAERQR